MTTVRVPEELARVEAALLAPGGPFEIVDVEVGGVTIRSFKNRIRTLRDLLLKSVDFGDNTYMLATDGVARTPAQLRGARAPRRVGRDGVPRPLTTCSPATASRSSVRTPPSG